MLIYSRRIVYNEGNQTVLHVPRDHTGRARQATTPTCEIVDLRAGETSSERTILAETSASPSSETDPLSATSGPSQGDPTKINGTDSSDFTSGRVYLISEAGATAEVMIERIDTTAHDYYSATDLPRDFSSSATIAAVMLEATFPTAEAADETEVEDGGGPYAVIWRYTIDGVKYVVPEQRWLSRYSIQPWIGPSDITRAWPAFSSQLRGRFSLTIAAEQACADVLSDLQSSGKDEYFLGAQRHRMAVIKALQICHEWTGELDMADRRSDDYQRKLNADTVGASSRGSVEIDPVTETSPSGTARGYGVGLIRRS